MTVKIRKIGNSSGIILSKSILDLCQITEADQLELSVKDNKIVIEKIVRKDWDKMFQAAGKDDDTTFLSEDLDAQFENEDWTW